MSKSRRKLRRRQRAGFTLMEVLLVLAILVMLGSIAYFTFGDYFSSAQVKNAKIQIDSLTMPINTFRLEEGRWPQSLDELWSMSTPKQRRYVAPLNADPWNNPYQYQPPDPNDPTGTFRVWSMGPNGQNGDADDIGNWQQG